MGHVPDWVRKSHAKEMKLADGGEVDDSGVKLELGGGSNSLRSGEKIDALGGRLSYKHNLDADSSLTVGVSGSMARGKSGDFDVNVKRMNGADLTYAKKDSEYSVSYHNDMTPEGKPDKKVMFNYRKRF